MPERAKKAESPEPYQRGDFLRDLEKASRKLEPEEREPKKKRPSGRSGGFRSEPGQEPRAARGRILVVVASLVAGLIS
jgi:hypothetical protein